MGANNISFYKELTKIILQLSPISQYQLPHEKTCLPGFLPGLDTNRAVHSDTEDD